MRKNVLQDKMIESITRFQERVVIEYGDRCITYTELDQRSDVVANFIINKGIEVESPVGILVNDRMDFILTMIGILKARCMFVPLEPGFPPARLEMLIRSINANYVFVDNVGLSRLASGDVKFKQEVELILIDDLFLKRENIVTDNLGDRVEYNSEDKIYIYFTSGTTGAPKPVVGKNSSLLHFIQWEIETLNIDSDFRFSQFITPTFDPFLRDVFVPLLSGAVICIPGDKNMIVNSSELIEWLDQYRINLSHCVPALFRLLSSNSLNKDSFKYLKFVLLAGEKIEPPDLVGWYETFNDRIQLVNLYGPTETTLAKICYFIQQEDIKRERIPIGKPIRGARVIILDERMSICDRLEKGEIYIRTPFRSFGYCNDPELNNKKFITNPFSANPLDIIYKTGDLGRLLNDGNIDILGRVDRQVKIRGIRIELEEIESVLAKHPVVKEVVVIKKEVSQNSHFLCAYFTAVEKETVGKEELVKHIREYLSGMLPDYMIPVYLGNIEKIPRKPNGKTDYSLLPDPLEKGKEDIGSPRDEIEKKLLDIWSDILKINTVGMQSNFFKLGGNSLNFMSLISRIHAEFDIRLTLEQVFKNITIKMQAELIRSSLQGERQDRFVSIKAAEEKDYFALSPAQKRLYFLQKLAADNVSYNIPHIVVLEGNLDKERLENVFRKLINRHESLRTSFELIGGIPLQKIHKRVDFAPEYHELKKEEAKEKIEAFVRPFDLNKAPLFRLGLIKVENEEHILMMDIHHIISDGASTGIIINEFVLLYTGQELGALRLRYKDYSEWKLSEEQIEAVKKQEEYWLREFAGEIPKLDLPIDYNRPEVQSFSGKLLRFEIGPEYALAVKELARDEEATPFMVLLAVTNILFAKITGQEDILVGTPIEGRRHQDLKQIIGMFVNTLVLRNFPSKGKTFVQFLREVKRRSLEIFENQDYQFEDLVDKVAHNRDPAKNPLFDVVFVLHDLNTEFLEIPGLRIKPYETDTGTAKFDLSCNFTFSGRNLVFGIEYCTKLFKEETIVRYVRYFMEILSLVVDDKNIKLKDVSITHDLISLKSNMNVSKIEFGFEN